MKSIVRNCRRKFPFRRWRAGAFDSIDVIGDINAGGFVHGKKSFALISEQDRNSFYNVSTAFRQMTSFTTYESSSDITAVNNSITMGNNGEYYVMPTGSANGHALHDLTFSVFLNGTTNVMQRTSSLGAGHLHAPVLVNYSGPTVDSGSVADLEHEDGVYLIVNEAGGVPNIIDCMFNTDIIEPKLVSFGNFLYDGSAVHTNRVFAYNFVFGRYTALTANDDDLPDSGGTDAFRYYNRAFGFPEPHADYSDGDSAKVRVFHEPNGTGTHDWFFDRVQLLDNHAGSSITYIDKISLVAGDTLTLHIKSDENQSHTRISDARWAVWEVSD